MAANIPIGKNRYLAVMKTKAEYRKEVRERKAAYTTDDLAAHSARIWEQLEALPEFRDAQIIAAYWSLPDEVQTQVFIESWCREKTILLPVMCEGNRLELKPYTPGCRMNEVAFCISEPEGEPFPPERVDLILVPGLAFDRSGNRLGRGKGYYDRLLRDMCACKVGVCFDFQLFDEIPADDHDILMDIVLHG